MCMSHAKTPPAKSIYPNDLCSSNWTPVRCCAEYNISPEMKNDTKFIHSHKEILIRSNSLSFGSLFFSYDFFFSHFECIINRVSLSSHFVYLIWIRHFIFARFAGMESFSDTLTDSFNWPRKLYFFSLPNRLPLTYILFH